MAGTVVHEVVAIEVNSKSIRRLGGRAALSTALHAPNQSTSVEGVNDNRCSTGVERIDHDGHQQGVVVLLIE